MKKYTFLFLLLLVPQVLLAATWVVNRDHSEIMFQVTYMNVTELNGRFNEFTGEAILNDKALPSELQVNIKSASIDTGNRLRDGHLKDQDFLQADHFPEIIFLSKKISRISNGKYRAEGPLTIKGITKSVVVDFTVSEAVKDTWGFDNRFVKFTAKINRKDFNIVWNKTLDGQQFLVGNSIGISGNFQLQPAGKKTPNSKHMIPDTEHIRTRDQKRIEDESSISKKLRNLINGK